MNRLLTSCVFVFLFSWPALVTSVSGQEFKLSIHNNGRNYPLSCLADSGKQIKAEYSFLGVLSINSLVSRLPVHVEESIPDQKKITENEPVYVVDLKKIKIHDLIDVLKEGKKNNNKFLFVGRMEDIRSELRPMFAELEFTGFLLDDKYLPEITTMLPGMICISAKVQDEEHDRETGERSTTSTRSDRNSLKVFPNPAQSMLQVIFESDEIFVNGRLTLISATGQIVEQQSVSAAGQYSFDITQLPSGNYTLACLGCKVDALPVVIQRGY